VTDDALGCKTLDSRKELMCNPCTVPLACLLHAGVAASLETFMLNIGELSINGCRKRRIIIIIIIIIVITIITSIISVFIINGCRWAVPK